MSQSTEQATFSTGNDNGTRERQVGSQWQQSFFKLKDSINAFADTTTASESYTVTARDWDRTILVDAITVAKTIVIPAANTANGGQFTVLFVGDAGSAGSLTMSTSTAPVGFIRENYVNEKIVDIAGTDNQVFTQAQTGSCLHYMCDGNRWYVSGQMKYVTVYNDLVCVTFPDTLYTVLASNSGKVHMLSNPTDENKIVNLGSPTSTMVGARFTFILAEDMDVYTISFLAAGSGFNGTVTNGTLGTLLVCDTENDVILDNANKRGSWVEVVSDGTIWAIRGMATGGVTAP